MNDMTDSFMSLAAVAVFATGTTRLTNVANQRVKECNRLAVMVSELTRCGVQARELPTGIEIVGVGRNASLVRGALGDNESQKCVGAIVRQRY